MPFRYGNSHAIWDHSVTCYPAEMISHLLPQQIKSCAWFSDPGRMLG